MRCTHFIFIYSIIEQFGKKKKKLGGPPTSKPTPNDPSSERCNLVPIQWSQVVYTIDYILIEAPIKSFLFFKKTTIFPSFKRQIIIIKSRIYALCARARKTKQWNMFLREFFSRGEKKRPDGKSWRINCEKYKLSISGGKDFYSILNAFWHKNEYKSFLIFVYFSSLRSSSSLPCHFFFFFGKPQHNYSWTMILSVDRDWSKLSTFWPYFVKGQKVIQKTRHVQQHTFFN